VSFFSNLLANLLGRNRANKQLVRHEMTSRIDPGDYSTNSADTRARLLLERALKEGDGDPFPGLLEALRGTDPKLSMSAAQVIGNIANQVPDQSVRRELVQSLINAMRTPSHFMSTTTGFPFAEIAPVQVQAAEALGKLGDPGAILELGEALHSPIPGVRRAASWALGAIGAPEAIDVLSEVLNDPDGDVRSTVRNSLRRIGTPDALSLLD
jgi:HEAT repeat protein